MAGARGNASVADKYNLTEAEADWVERQVEAGRDVEDVVRQVRSERVGPASLPDSRPLPADVADELGVNEPVPSPPVDVDDQNAPTAKTVVPDVVAEPVPGPSSDDLIEEEPAALEAPFGEPEEDVNG